MIVDAVPYHDLLNLFGFYLYIYTNHVGLGISVISRIASPFSRQIAIGNAGPVSALESMVGMSHENFKCRSAIKPLTCLD